MAMESKFKKETKIGIAVIGILLVVFGIVLFSRLSGGDDSVAAENTNTPGETQEMELSQLAQSPTVVPETIQAPHAHPISRGSDAQSDLYSARRSAIDEAAQKNLMSSSSTQNDGGYPDSRYGTQDDSRDGVYGESVDDDSRNDVQYNDSPREIGAKSTDPYGAYASDRSGTAYEDANTVDQSPEGAQFRQRSAATFDARPNARPTAQRVQPRTSQEWLPADRPDDIANGQSGASQQGVESREIGRVDYESSPAAGNQIVANDASSASYRQDNTTRQDNTPRQDNISRQDNAYDSQAKQSAPYDPYEQRRPISDHENVLRNNVTQQSPPADAIPNDAILQQPIEEQATVPSRPSDGKYMVMPNDNYSAIAKKVYGDARYFKALAEHNRQAHPRIHSLQVGDEVLTPELTVLRKKFGSLCPKLRTATNSAQFATTASESRPTKIYVVEQGDTIYDIAKYELGKASRWAEIIALNRSLLGNDIHFVRPGMKLRLPDDAAARQPASRVVREITPESRYVR